MKKFLSLAVLLAAIPFIVCAMEKGPKIGDEAKSEVVGEAKAEKADDPATAPAEVDIYTIKNLYVTHVKVGDGINVKHEYYLLHGAFMAQGIDDLPMVKVVMADATGALQELKISKDPNNDPSGTLIENNYCRMQYSYANCQAAQEKVTEFCGKYTSFTDDADFVAWTANYCNTDGTVNQEKLEAFERTAYNVCKNNVYKETGYEVCGSLLNHATMLGNGYRWSCSKYRSFSCALSTEVNTSLTADSKVTLQFFDDGVAVAEIADIDLKGALDGKMVSQNLAVFLVPAMIDVFSGAAKNDDTDGDGMTDGGMVEKVTKIVKDNRAAGKADPDAPPLLIDNDSDGDGTPDLLDKFPTVQNEVTEIPVKFTSPRTSVEVSPEQVAAATPGPSAKGGGDCGCRLSVGGEVHGLLGCVAFAMCSLLGLWSWRRRCL